MKFWFSGELDTQVVELYTATRKSIEGRLNAHFANCHYGPMLVKIAIIPMILRPESVFRKERRLFQRKKASADYRTTIDFDQFRTGVDKIRERLLLKNVVEAIEDLQRKIGKCFAGEKLVADVLTLFEVSRQQLDET